MYSGYLLKRNNPHGAPPLQKTFCILWGTHLMDYESEEDAKCSMSPKGVLELIGVSEWDIEPSSFQQYTNNFLVVTHTGGTYYLSTTTAEDRDIWMLKIKGALECMFANTAVIGYKPTKHFQSKPKPIPILPIGTVVHSSDRPGLGSISSTNYNKSTTNNSNTTGAPAFCAKTGVALPPSHTIHCPCCGCYYSSIEYINDSSTAIQIQIEESVKMCFNCKSTQCCLIWMKNMCYIHIMHLHEMTPAVQTDIKKFKSSFKLRRKDSTRLDMAAQLLEQQNISPSEFEELRVVDCEYRLENVISEGDRIQATLELLGNDMQTMISLLMSSSAADATGRLSFYQVILKILSLADSEPDLIDFYFPQLVQVHFLESKTQTKSSLTKVDLLQQALLAISAKYPALSLRLAWNLLGIVGDYHENRIDTCQYAASMVLLLQLELLMTGNVSCLVPAGRQALLLKQQDCVLYGEVDVMEMPPLLTPATIDTAIASIHDETTGNGTGTSDSGTNKIHAHPHTPDTSQPDFPASAGSPMTPNTGTMFRNVATPVPNPSPNIFSTKSNTNTNTPNTANSSKSTNVDVPSTPPKICRQLTSVFKAAEHQQETLIHDLRVLFRLRYSLYEAEAKIRYARDRQKEKEKQCGVVGQSQSNGSSVSGVTDSPSVSGKTTVPSHLHLPTHIHLVVRAGGVDLPTPVAVGRALPVPPIETVSFCLTVTSSPAWGWVI